MCIGGSRGAQPALFETRVSSRDHAALATFAIVAACSRRLPMPPRDQAMKGFPPSRPIARPASPTRAKPDACLRREGQASACATAADLSKTLASALGAPVDFTIVARPVNLLRTDRIDIGFMPVDDEAAHGDRSPSYLDRTPISWRRMPGISLVRRCRPRRRDRGRHRGSTSHRDRTFILTKAADRREIRRRGDGDHEGTAGAGLRS